MPRPKLSIPSYKLHKPTGQARVRINGKCVYLGKFNSPESRKRYGELITGMQADVSTSQPSPSGTVRTDRELLLKFSTESLPGYSRADRKNG